MFYQKASFYQIENQRGWFVFVFIFNGKSIQPKNIL